MINRLILSLLGVCLTIALSSEICAQQAPTPPPAARISAANPSSFDPAAATQAWLNTVPPDQRAKSDAYFEGGYWLILWNFLLVAAISILLLVSRTSAALRDFTESITRFKTPQVIVYAIAFTLITTLLGFPLELYQSFFREHAYGLSTQNFGSWMGDEVKGLVVGLITNAILLSALYLVFRRAPRFWWAFGTGVAILLFIVGVMVAPIFIFPLFNKFQPLTDAKIRDPILALARANEIPVMQVYEFDASRQTTKPSANVSGFLGTTRISLNDNLLKQSTLPEIRYVMGHEMGHYVLNHTMKLFSGFVFFALVGFLLARLAFDLALRKWGDRWRIRGIADPAGFPLLVIIFSTLAFVLTPIINTVSRNIEREADAFGINTSREADGMAQAALKLGTYRKMNPGPIEEFIFFDHPSGRARIRMAMDWKAARLPAGDVDLTR
jgi:Zn-dependent protease with chaperone function